MNGHANQRFLASCIWFTDEMILCENHMICSWNHKKNWFFWVATGCNTYMWRVCHRISGGKSVADWYLNAGVNMIRARWWSPGHNASGENHTDSECFERTDHMLKGQGEVKASGLPLWWWLNAREGLIILPNFPRKAWRKPGGCYE